MNRKHEKCKGEAPSALISQLHDLGLNVETIAELVNQQLDYREAVPILIEWLSRVDDLDVKESIVRALTTEWAKPEAARPLIVEFREAPPEEEFGLKWTIANAIEVVADESVFDDIVALVEDKKHGRAREMLAEALGNVQDPRAISVLISLLNEEEIAGHVLVGLRRQLKRENVRSSIRGEEVKSAVTPFLDHPQLWVRREAKRVLKWVEKAESVKHHG